MGFSIGVRIGNSWGQNLIAGRYRFMAFRLFEKPTVTDTMDQAFNKAISLVTEGLADTEDITTPDVKKFDYGPIAGWYDVVTKEYGWAYILVAPNTGPEGPWGTITTTNDGQQYNNGGWFTITWTTPTGLTLYLHYADVGPDDNPGVRFSIGTVAPN